MIQAQQTAIIRAMRIATVAALVLATAWLSAPAANAQSRSDDEPPQTPQTICKCNGYTGDDRGGARTFEEFNARYGRRFTSDFLFHAWNVYDVVNRCDAMIAIGKNDELKPLQGKQGLCVMRVLKPWNLDVNDIYLQAGLDRGTRVLLASPLRMEVLSKPPQVKPSQVVDDDNHWKVIYNRELAQVRDTGRYALKGDLDDATPERPAFFEPDCVDISGVWTGSMVVREVTSGQIAVGQQRNVTITLSQKNCLVKLEFNTNKLDGAFNGPGMARLDWHPTGALVRADFKANGATLMARFEQQLGGGRVISEGLLRRQ